MAMENSLHNQNYDQLVYTCNDCKKHVETRYHCSICEDFDLCVICYNKDGHKHRMEKLGFGLDDDLSNSDPQKTTNPQDSKELSIQRCVQSLVHFCHCRDTNCGMLSCLNMKKLVAHAKQCKRKTINGCSICKQFIALCYHHAKACKETKCTVLFCLNIRHKLRQRQLQQGNPAAFLDFEVQILKRRIAAMIIQEMPSAVNQNNGGNSNPINQPSPRAQQPKPQQSEKLRLRHKQSQIIGPNNNMSGPMGNAIVEGQPQIVPNQEPSNPNQLQHSLQSLIQALKYPSFPQQQQQQVLSILKSNPQLRAAFIKRRTAKKALMQ